MAVDHEKTSENWARYVYLRENGHLEFINKANKCNAFVLGDQWDKADAAKLRAVRRPALTINQTLPTVAALMGEQINTRVDFSFKAKRTSGEDLSNTLEKIFRKIEDDVLYQQQESMVFDDGIITSRGYFDVRLGFTGNMQGEIELCALNPNNVLVDCDAEDYDPVKWGDVITTKWLSPLDIRAIYNEEDADYLMMTPPDAYNMETYDSVYRQYETFRASPNQASPYNAESREYRRNIRVVERQYYKLTKQKTFVDLATGDTAPVPEEWDRNKIAFVCDKYRLTVVDMMAKKIWWRTTAGPCVLHDAWSPYKYFTVVPYFPYFRRGKTMGVVENLLGPQELLNKAISQELHVINTTANSGWKVKQGSLRNMTTDELEQRGAQTGIVLALDDVKNAEKIEPNQIPTGLDRIVYKAQEFIQSISTVNDTALGNDREDVAARAIAKKEQNLAKTHAKIFDNLNYTRLLLMRRMLDIVQGYFTERRVYRITKDDVTGEEEELVVNAYDEAVGRIVNDLSLGEYDVKLTVTPNKDTINEVEFDQAIAMRELGIKIPDEFLIEASNLKGKRKLLKALQAANESPEAQQEAQLAQRAALAEISLTEAETERKQADTTLKAANARKVMSEAINGPDTGGGENPALREAELAHESAENEQDRALRREEMAHETQERLGAEQHEKQVTVVEQQHDAGMAQLGHLQNAAESERGYEQSMEAQETSAKHAAQADERKAKLAKQQAAAKPKKVSKK